MLYELLLFDHGRLERSFLSNFQTCKHEKRFFFVFLLDFFKFTQGESLM